MRKLWGALTNMTDVLKKRGNLDTGQTSTMESPVKRRREKTAMWREGGTGENAGDGQQTIRS